MRLTIIISGMAIGGAQRSLVKFATAIHNDVKQICIVCLTNADDDILSELPKNVIVEVLNTSSSLNPFLWLRVSNMLRKQKPDVVIGWATYANFVAIIASFFSKKRKLIISERNYAPQMFKKTTRSGLRSRLVLTLMKLLYPRADTITANSDENLYFLKRYIKSTKQHKLLPNIVNIDELDLRAKENFSGIKYNINGPKILSLGRLCHQKGFDVLLAAFAKVRETHDWNLVISGDGPEKNELKEQAKTLGIDEAIHWTGKVSNPFPYYLWADMVVVASRFEGFPNVPLEAMAIGRAVLCSDCKTGPKELTVRGQFARLVPVEDVDALAASIIEFGMSSERREKMGQAARAHIKKTYDTDAVSKKYLDVLNIVNE